VTIMPNIDTHACRRCSECPDASHHWMSGFDAGEWDHSPEPRPIWVCKHCSFSMPMDGYDVEGARVEESLQERCFAGQRLARECEGPLCWAREVVCAYRLSRKPPWRLNMPPARKKPQPKEVRVELVDDAVLDRLERLEQAYEEQGKVLQQFLDMFTAKEPKKRERVLKPPTKAQLQVAARRARQGRAAKRLGITVATFVKRYGDIDYVPEEAKAKKKR